MAGTGPRTAVPTLLLVSLALWAQLASAVVLTILPAGPVLAPTCTWAATTVKYEAPKPPAPYCVTRRYCGLPQRPDPYVETFKCTFEDHACGMRNQANMKSFFKLVSNTIADRPGRYMAVDSHRFPAGASRLITPYLPGFPNSRVCLRLTYFMCGPGVERLLVVAQDRYDRLVLCHGRPGISGHQDGAWRTVGVNITVNQDVRFFIDAYTNGRPGTFAIDDFTYSFQACR